MSDLEDRINQIEADMELLVRSHTAENVWTTHYGAFEIDPQHLVYKLCVETETERIRLVNLEPLKLQLRYILEKYDYPPHARPRVYIGFESDEAINRDSGGNPWRHWR